MRRSYRRLHSDPGLVTALAGQCTDDHCFMFSVMPPPLSVIECLVGRGGRTPQISNTFLIWNKTSTGESDSTAVTGPVLTNYDTLYRLTTECKSLRELVQTLQDANSKLEEESLASAAVSKVSRLVFIVPAASQVFSPQVGQTGPGRSLEEAEEKIAGLLEVKEKLVTVQVIARPGIPGNISLSN